MNRIIPLALLIAAAIGSGACNRVDETTAASITVQLPPARPHVPKPAFSFEQASATDASAARQRSNCC